MSITFTKLCSIVLDEYFGQTVKSIGHLLMQKGALTLAGIVYMGNLPVAKVQKALKTLLQHDLVTHSTPEEETEPVYKIHANRIYVFIRYSRYIALVDNQLGLSNDCRDIIQEMFFAGEVTLSKLLYVFGQQLVKSSGTGPPESSVLYGRLKCLLDSFRVLADKRLVSRGIRTEIDPNGLDNTQKSSDFIIPPVDLNSLCSKVLSSNPELNEEPDGDVYWRVDVLTFKEIIRNSVIVSAMNLKFKPFVDYRIFDVILEKGLKNEPWSEMTSQVSVYEIRDTLNKKDGGNLTVKNIFEHLQIVEDDPMEIIYKTSDLHGGVYSLSMKIAFTQLMWQTVERLITERHGYEAARIFRLIKTKKYIEQDSIHELGMIPAKEAKHITYTLVENNFIVMKEVRKSYAVSAATNKIIYLFYIDINHVVYSLLENCYKAIINSKLRSSSEKEKHSRLLIKEERINRILENMSSQNCTDEQIQEVEEMITPPERAVLSKVQGQTDKLAKGVYQIDDTVFILEMYMFYNSIGKQPIKKKNVRN